MEQTSPIHAAPAYTLEAAQAAQCWKTNADSGLTSAQVSQSRETSGWNELAAEPPVSQWKIFLSQFQDVVVWILMAAAMISGLMGDWTDAAAILAILVLNALLGYFQEGRAEQALAGLRKMIVPTAKVIREGKLQSIPASDLVPGDLIKVEAGDHVPADARLWQASSLKVQESVLTGESVPVEKDAAKILAADTAIADRINMIFMGSTVAAGSARAVVVATGMQTEIGQIAGMLESYERKATPLQRELASVGRTLAMICLGIVAVVFGLSLWRGDSLMAGILTAISLAVAAVPEGLPAVVTVTLALGLMRMVNRNALIRKLHSVETLGCVTTICSDKTGTLTRNEMTVRELVIGDQHYQISGAGYDPVGEFTLAGESKTFLINDWPDSLREALVIGAVCNSSQISLAKDGNAWQVVGDPMEGALIIAYRKAGERASTQLPHVIDELPFDSDRKMMSVLVKDSDGFTRQFTKGAPEALLPCCTQELTADGVRPLGEGRRKAVSQHAEEMAGRALRVLALAARPSSRIEERDLTFAGLVGIIDPPRSEVRNAIATCDAAGIRTVMITGDHPVTAAAIGRELGLLKAEDEVVTGNDLERLSDAELADRVATIGVYARVAPAHKLRVVSALQKQSEVVAMTGDGVNDAPAVKSADIGIAMGRTGTDVTREAAAMVLLDDNFTSIVSAVEEGRAIYDNIRKILVYLLSCNIGEMLLMLIAAIIGWPSPLLPIQLLWINLVTDGLPAFALAMESPEPDLMQRRPRASNEKMMSTKLGEAVIVQGMLLATVGLVAFRYGIVHSDDVEHARTLAFNAIVLSELLRVLAARSTRQTFWQLGALTNPYVFGAVSVSLLLQIVVISLPLTRPVFEVTDHSFQEWLLVSGLALVPVTVLECRKLVRQWRQSSASSPA